MIYDDGAAYSGGPTRFSVHHALQVSTRKKRGLIAADVRRFGHAINTDEVFGTHTANFPRPAALRLLPTCETPAQQHARWRRRILLRDGAPCDRAYVATGPYIRSSELCSVVEGAHGNVARKTKWWLEHEIP